MLGGALALEGGIVSGDGTEAILGLGSSNMNILGHKCLSTSGNAEPLSTGQSCFRHGRCPPFPMSRLLRASGAREPCLRVMEAYIYVYIYIYIEASTEIAENTQPRCIIEVKLRINKSHTFNIKYFIG